MLLNSLFPLTTADLRISSNTRSLSESFQRGIEQLEVCFLRQVLHQPTSVQDFVWNLFARVLLEFPLQHSGCRQVSREETSN